MKKKIQTWNHHNNSEEFALQTFLKTIDDKSNLKKITNFRLLWGIPDKGFVTTDEITAWQKELSSKQNNPTLDRKDIEGVKIHAFFGFYYKDWYPDTNRLVAYWKNIDHLRIDLKLPPRWGDVLQDYLLNGKVNYLYFETGIQLDFRENQLNGPDVIIAEIDFNTTYEDYLAKWPEIQEMQCQLPQKSVKKRKPLQYLARNRLAWQLYFIEKLPMNEVINQMVAEEYPRPSPEDIYTWVKSYKKFIAD